MSMDYEKAYKEALELARGHHGVAINYGKTEEIQELEHIFPELAKSEDERIRKILIHIVKGACDKYGIKYKGDDITEEKLLAYLEKQKEQNPGDKDRYMEGYINGMNDALKELKEQKPAEWNEEDENAIRFSIDWLSIFRDRHAINQKAKEEISFCIDKLKSLRPQPKREDEPMEIKFAGKIYKVHGKKDMPGGAIGYIIEDEPGHYDCIINPDEVLGGGYGIKGCGSPYPTKEANFGQPHWKPSDEQMEALARATNRCVGVEDAKKLLKLFEQLESL